MAVRQKPGFLEGEGAVEAFVNHEWATLMPDISNTNNARVLCRLLHNGSVSSK